MIVGAAILQKVSLDPFLKAVTLMVVGCFRYCDFIFFAIYRNKIPHLITCMKFFDDALLSYNIQLTTATSRQLYDYTFRYIRQNINNFMN